MIDSSSSSKLDTNSIELILNSLLESNEESLLKLIENQTISNCLNLIFLDRIQFNSTFNNEQVYEQYQLEVVNNDKIIKIKLYSIILKLSKLKKGLNLNLIFLFTSLFKNTNDLLVEDLITKAIEIDSNLLEEIKTKGLEYIINSINSITITNSIQSIKSILNLILPFLTSSTTISTIFGKSNKLLKSIINLYDIILPKLKPNKNDDSNPSSSSLNSPLNQWLLLRLNLLETTHSLLSSSYLYPLSLHPVPNERIILFDSLESLLIPFLELTIKSSNTGSVGLNSNHLMNVPFLMDLNHYFNIGEGLSKSNGLRQSVLVDLFSRLEEVSSRMTGEDGLEVLRRVVRIEEEDARKKIVLSGGKGKGKVVESNSSSIPSPTSEALDLSISQILDVFPNYSPSFLRSCLLHPFFSSSGSAAGAAEEVITALLEDNLPVDLRDDSIGSGDIEEVEIVQEEKKILPTTTSNNTRRNIFDQSKLDSSKISRGKSTNITADLLLDDKSFMTIDYKNLIIERAERESSDEEDDEEEGGKEVHTEAFLEDFDDDRTTFGVRDGNNNDDDDEPSPPPPSQSSTPSVDPLSNPITPTISKILELQYLSDPTLFDRSSVIRKSKLRVALRERTGLADEQLEGWKVMLDRNPRKDKILSKHSFSANKNGVPLEESDGLTKDIFQQPNQQQQGGSSSRGGRGGARGGGGERGGERGRGKSDGGRAAHDRRQRGNDRKMAKVT